MSKKASNVGERIRTLRFKNKLSQSMLANLLFVSNKVVSKWEKGRSIPDANILLDLSNVFGVSIEYILTGETSYIKPDNIASIVEGHYVGVDGDRLFTRDEVTRILKRRIDRYQNSVFLKYGVKNAQELDKLVATYYFMKDAFDFGDKKDDKSEA